ncbi:hypothetical protein PG993_003982 [Apiospora rasikravindrae]|uniref:Uncharacterized protein n=1 Tax=Apiospora rasikravindrae TaxID=990691 RepID=A0ABR1U1L8_9PEZI
MAKDAENASQNRHETNLQALLATLLDGSTMTAVDFEAFLACKVSKDSDTTNNDASKHLPSHLQSPVASWNARSQESKIFDHDVCRNMERQHRLGAQLVYTENGYFGLSPEGEVDRGMVVAVVGRAFSLTVLKRRTDGRDVWYERCNRVSLYGWDKQKFKTLQDIDEHAEVVRLQIR